MSFPKRNHALEETKNVRVRAHLAPVQPSRFIVLVIGIVIAELRVQEFVSGPEHWGPVREKQQTAEILDLLSAQRQYLWRRPFFPFVAAVPRVVLVHAILIAVTIRPVALLVVRDEIVQGEAVVGGYIVHALIGVISLCTTVGKEIVAAIDATHQVRDHPRIAFNKTADVIAEPCVPLQPGNAWEAATKLISAGVPGFCDEMQLTQLWISGDFTEYGSVSPIEGPVRIAAEHRRQIKAESVDMHFMLPVPQAVHHHFAYVSFTEIQSVARAGVVGVGVHRVGGQHVIASGVETFVAVDRSLVIALASVVVDDIEHDADTSLVKSLDHVSKFEVLLIIVAVTRVLRMRREEVQRHVAPVVALLWIALKDRHQFDNGYPEFPEIRDLLHQTGIRAGTRRFYAGVGVLSEALHVKLVDDCIRLVMRRAIPCPVKFLAVTGQRSQRCPACVWALSHCQFAIEAGWKENALRIRINETFLRVEAMKVRSCFSRHGICVITSLAYICDRNPAMPYPA